MSRHADLMHAEACRIDACRMSVERRVSHILVYVAMEESRSFMPRFAGPVLRNSMCLRTTRLCYSSIVVKGRKVVVGVADFLF